MYKQLQKSTTFDQKNIKWINFSPRVQGLSRSLKVVCVSLKKSGQNAWNCKAMPRWAVKKWRQNFKRKWLAPILQAGFPKNWYTVGEIKSVYVHTTYIGNSVIQCYYMDFRSWNGLRLSDIKEIWTPSVWSKNSESSGIGWPSYFIGNWPFKIGNFWQLKGYSENHQQQYSDR